MVSMADSEVVENIRSVKSGRMDVVVVEEAGGAVTLGGAMVFMR